MNTAKKVELSPGDVTVSPGTYIDFGDPYIMSEEGMWYTYGCPIFDVRVSGDRIDLEKDGGVWVYNNWEWEDIVGVTYELEKGIWPFFDDKNSGYSDAENWIKAHSDRQWIIIPTGTRPQKGTHTFTVKVSAGGSTASYPVSFKMSPDQEAKAATVLNEEMVFARKNAAATSADAADIAAEYAKLGRQSFVVSRASSGSGYSYDMSCPNCGVGGDTAKKTLFVKIAKSGKATLSGSIAGTKVSGTSYLVYDDEYECVFARFFIGGFVIEIEGGTEYFCNNGSLWGRVWPK